VKDIDFLFRLRGKKASYDAKDFSAFGYSKGS
jgi:hypothetical protein